MATMQTHTANTASRGNPALDVLLSYPLMQAIGERRTRRVAQGCSILAGPLSHHSTNSPMPLSSLEGRAPGVLDRGKLAIRGQSGQGEDPEWAYRLPS